MNFRTLALATAILAAPTLLQAQDSRPSSKPVKGLSSTDGYPLGTCVVSGMSLAKMSKVVKVDGRTIKVCSAGHAKMVEKDPATYIKKLDAAVIAQQSANYPLEKCLISGRVLASMGNPRNLVVDGQLVKVCCGGCIKKAKTTLKEFVLSSIKKAAYAKQIVGHEKGKGMTCPVSNKPADRKKTAQFVMHGNTLVAVCCKSCLKKFKASPNKYMAAAGGAKASSRPAGKKDGQGGDHNHGGGHGKKGEHGAKGDGKH